MRWIPVLCLLPLLTSGCFVFEELDKGMEIMEAHTPQKAKEAEAAAAQGADGEKAPTYAQSVGNWFQKAKSLAPREQTASDDPMVPCTAQGKTLFTRRSDCLARGGKAG